MTALNLVTYRHILQHSLMPWLDENRDIQKFNALTRLIPNTFSEGNYFSHLQTAFKQTGTAIPSSLAAEWKELSAIPASPYTKPVREIFGTPVSRNKPYGFYLRLITEVTCAYIAEMERCAGRKQSADLRKSHASTLLKSCHDMMEQAVVLLDQKEAYRPILTELLTGLKIIFLETGLLHRGYYEPYLFYLNDEDICALGKQECGENISGRDTNTWATRFEAWYNKKRTVKPSQQAGSNSIANIEQPVHTSPEVNDRGENWQKLVTIYEGDKSTSAESPAPLAPETVPAATPAAGKEDTIIGREEVMRLLGIGKTKLGKMSQNGEIPCFKIAGRYKYKRNEIMSYQQSLNINTQLSAK